MMTIVTHVTIEPGKEPLWDAAFRERAETARTQTGWIGLQLVMPIQALNKRIVIGTWENRAAWESWHATEPFQRTRAQMDGLEIQPRDEWWHEVILEEHV